MVRVGAALAAVVALHLTVLSQEGGGAQKMHCIPGALAVGLPFSAEEIAFQAGDQEITI